MDWVNLKHECKRTPPSFQVLGLWQVWQGCSGVRGDCTGESDGVGRIGLMNLVVFSCGLVDVRSCGVVVVGS